VIGIIYIPYLGRPIRGQVLSLREKEFVEAAAAQGKGPLQIMFGELLPNLASTILVFGTLIGLGLALLIEALDTRVRSGEEVAERLGRQVPRTRTAIDELTGAYVEGTYANRTPGVDPWPGWLAARRAVIRGLFSRKLGAWFGEDTSVALPPRSHPELLRQWGRRGRRE